MFAFRILLFTLFLGNFYSSDLSANPKQTAQKIQSTPSLDPSKMYTVRSEAQKSLGSRTHLRQAVETHWRRSGLDVDKILNCLSGCAVLSRQLPAFRMEDQIFIELARRFDFEPAWATVREDYFSERSPLKRSYLYPKIPPSVGLQSFIQLNRIGEDIYTRHNLVRNQKELNAMRLMDIRTHDGEILETWHLKRFQSFHPSAKIVDISSLFFSSDDKTTQGSRIDVAKYENFFSMFISHAVLFENYYGGESGRRLMEFSEKVAFPAFLNTTEKFDARPIILRMDWEPPYFALYPTPH